MSTVKNHDSLSDASRIMLAHCQSSGEEFVWDVKEDAHAVITTDSIFAASVKVNDVLRHCEKFQDEWDVRIYQPRTVSHESNSDLASERKVVTAVAPHMDGFENIVAGLYHDLRARLVMEQHELAEQKRILLVMTDADFTHDYLTSRFYQDDEARRDSETTRFSQRLEALILHGGAVGIHVLATLPCRYDLTRKNSGLSALEDDNVQKVRLNISWEAFPVRFDDARPELIDVNYRVSMGGYSSATGYRILSTRGFPKMVEVPDVEA